MLRSCSNRPLPSRLLVVMIGVLATTLGVGGLGVPAEAVEGAAPTVTTVTMSPASAGLGDTVTLTATVTSGGDPVPHGEVLFDAAPSEATLWGADSYVEPYPDGSDVSWGPVSLGGDGTASTEITVDADTLPFLAAGAPFYVAAAYEPYDGLEIYDTEFSASDSDPVEVTVAAPAPTATTTTVTGPTTATAGTPTSLTATVSPVDAAGTVRFSVDGGPVGAAVPVASGSASAPYTFAAGSRIVSAAFTPADSAAYAPSADATGRTVTVQDPPPMPSPALPPPVLPPHVLPPTTTPLQLVPPPSPSMAGTGAPVGTATVVLTGSTGAPSCRAASAPRRTSTSDKFAQLVASLAFEDFESRLKPELKKLSRDYSVSGLLMLSPQPACRVRPGRPVAARTTTTTRVTCLPTATGYRCPLGSVPPGATFTASMTYPLPAVAAGKKLGVAGSVAATDPVTGATSTLVTKHTTVHVPRRTVLSATIAPLKKVRAVRRGAKVGYRVVVHNAGVIAAHRVRACFSPGKGARVRTAQGGHVTPRKACWTLPTLGKGKTVRRTLTFAAPRRRGALKPTLVVAPRKSEAGHVRLRGVLPVR